MNPHPSPLSFSGKSETQPRKIHIWEFPEEFYVKLEPTLIKQLVNRAVTVVKGVNKLAHVLNKDVSLIRDYRAGKYFISLSSLLKLCKLTGKEFAIEKVEPHIVAYKGGARVKQPIWNPHLPIEETPELFALMGHLTGDGGHDCTMAYYTNTHEALVQKFLSLLQSVFGEVSTRVVVEKSKPPIKDFLRVKFGLTIVRLFQHLYQVDCRTYTARVPRHLFCLSKEHAAAYLRAFGDDEGSVNDWITLCSANRELMQDLYTLVQTKFPELGKFAVFKKSTRKYKSTWKTIYLIHFKSRVFAKYKECIGFTHPEKQQELDRILARHVRGWTQRTPGTTRRMLLTVLKSKSMTAKDLARRLDVNPHTIRNHLKGLISSGVATPTTKVGRAQLFGLTETGQKLLELPPLGLELLDRGNGARDRVRKKLAILKALALVGVVVLGELKRRLGLPEEVIRNHLFTRWYRGHKSDQLGLMELGLVERSGGGVRADPYVYCLTPKGKRVAERLCEVLD